MLTRRSKLLVLVTGVVFAGILAGVGGAIMMDGDGAAGAAIVAPDEVELAALRDVPPEIWASLRQKRILFAHQSVGADVVQGLHTVLERVPEIGLRVVESRDPDALDTPGLVHFRAGRNEDAGSKMDDFAKVLGGPLGERADIAMLKFCYVELREGQDPRALFDSYRTCIDGLLAQRPAVRFVHVTMPLTTVETGPKSRAKRLLGRALRGYADNIPRNRYNGLLRDAYPRESLFDLALSEARLPDGREARYPSGGETWQCLSSGFARDRGHPNEAGGVAAARDLLLVLAAQCR